MGDPMQSNAVPVSSNLTTIILLTWRSSVDCLQTRCLTSLSESANSTSLTSCIHIQPAPSRGAPGRAGAAGARQGIVIVLVRVDSAAPLRGRERGAGPRYRQSCSVPPSMAKPQTALIAQSCRCVTTCSVLDSPPQQGSASIGPGRGAQPVSGRTGDHGRRVGRAAR